MAYYRAIYMSFWNDPTVEEDFTPEDKYFMLYVLTNLHTNLCGCYEISIKRMSDEMGYSRNKIEEILRRFRDQYKGKVLYDNETHELLIRNWYKYNWNDSPKLDSVLREEIEGVKSVQFKRILIELYNNRISVREGKSISLFPCGCSEEDLGEEESDESQIEMSVPILGVPPSSSESGKEDGDGLVFAAPTEIKQFGPNRGDEKRQTCPYDEIRDLFNEICVSFPKVRSMGKNRKIYVNARWTEYGGNIEVFREVFLNMEQSDFLKGSNGKWSANFDWAMLPRNFVKILEGNYRNKQSGGLSGGWSVIQNEAIGGQS